MRSSRDPVSPGPLGSVPTPDYASRGSRARIIPILTNMVGPPRSAGRPFDDPIQVNGRKLVTLKDAGRVHHERQTSSRSLCAAPAGKRGADVRPDFNWGKPPVRAMGVSIGHAAPIQWNSSIEGSPPLAAGSRLGRKAP